MKNRSKLTALTALAVTAPLAGPLAAQDTKKPKMLSPGQIVDQAAPEEWRAIVASDLLVMNLSPDTSGKDRTVIIQLMPAPFSQGWVRNIRKLAKANWWDGTSINRVQDNYVVQWGDPAGDGEDRKPLPDGLEVMTEGDYETSIVTMMLHDFSEDPTSANIENWKDTLDNAMPAYDPFQDDDNYPDRTTTRTKKSPSGWHDRDAYENWVDFHKSWPMANEGEKSKAEWWPVHCYGAVGVGRGLSPDTGSGAELYTVIGHAPRHLDRNIAVVGRIIEGMHHLSSLPRGFGPLGFYETAEERVQIQSIRLASELPEAEQPRFEYLNSEHYYISNPSTFRRYVAARANREPPFFIKPAGGADICNIPVPVRRVKGE